MLKFCSLYSGSTGNSLFIKTENTSLLVDAGVTCKKTEEALSGIGEDIKNIQGILITHEHIDHIRGLVVIAKKYNIPIYANKETWDSMGAVKEVVGEEKRKIIDIKDNLQIGDLEIKSFETPHDAINPCGYTIKKDKHKISIATDIGHMNENMYEHINNSDFVLLEANYDPQILKCSAYPYSLKRRIASSNGHLTNAEAGKTISMLVKNGLKQAMLGHLSKENNFPELAYSTVVEELKNNMCSMNDLSLQVAPRGEPSKIVTVA